MKEWYSTKNFYWSEVEHFIPEGTKQLRKEGMVKSKWERLQKKTRDRRVLREAREGHMENLKRITLRIHKKLIWKIRRKQKAIEESIKQPIRINKVIVNNLIYPKNVKYQNLKMIKRKVIEISRDTIRHNVYSLSEIEEGEFFTYKGRGYIKVYKRIFYKTQNCIHLKSGTPKNLGDRKKVLKREKSEFVLKLTDCKRKDIMNGFFKYKNRIYYRFKYLNDILTVNVKNGAMFKDWNVYHGYGSEDDDVKKVQLIERRKYNG